MNPELATAGDMGDESPIEQVDDATAVVDAWGLPYPCRAIQLDENGWAELLVRYLGPRAAEPHKERPFRRCLEVAKLGGAQTAVIETRYIDADYRSEYAALYAGAFRSYEDSAERIHFFRSDLSESTLWDLRPDHGYLGYMVIRPGIAGVVGRTVLAPPPNLASAVRTAIEEPVTFFGQQLVVRGVPFTQQDSRLGRCAQAACWMCHYMAFRRSEVARLPMGQFSLSTNPALGIGRPIPSTGLTIHQVTDLLRSTDLPPIHYIVDDITENDRPAWWITKGDTSRSSRVGRVCSRYLSSGFPVIAIIRASNGNQSMDHAYVVCGFARASERESARLVVHDDMRGPYLEVTSVERDVDPSSKTRYDWRRLVVPVPDKLWMTGEVAERLGRSLFYNAAQVAVGKGVAEARSVLDLYRNRNLGVRTYAIHSSDFKAGVRERLSADRAAVEHYSYARLSRYVWVVEGVDRDKRNRGVPECVIGEVLLDPTSDELAPHVLATRLPGILSIPRPDNPRWDVVVGSLVTASGGVSTP